MNTNNQKCEICGTEWTADEKLPCPTPENHKDNKIYRTHKEILGSFAKCITSQSSIIKDISPALIELKYILSERRGKLDVTDFETEKELYDFVKLMVCDIKTIADLNISKAVREGKVHAHNLFIDSRSRINPEYDFVDLDALTRNIYNDILKG